TLWRINKGWKKRKKDTGPGFVLDTEKGRWEKQSALEGDPEDPMGPSTKRVIPYVEDTRNCLLFHPLKHLEISQFRSLQAALKNAILIEFQLEDNELSAEALPEWETPELILFYESSEGGAGVLCRLFEDPGAMSRVMKQALELCHFDPETGEDQLKSEFAEEECTRACYDCLMSYGNQKDHPFLDRHEIHDYLLELRNADVGISPGENTKEDHLKKLRNLCDSDLEKKWLDLLADNNLYLPDKAQTLFEMCGTRADFYYSKHNAIIFIDGPDHDKPAIAEKDRIKRECLENNGYIVLSFSYKNKSHWLDTCAGYSSVFGYGKT
ncbi:MAG: DUF1998 domain-containing protein, partial [Candidatus Aegiribacteria sp.]|nr:DUF1998 domain-containing protein [Candidatus Aegiribacteria sp.]